MKTRILLIVMLALFGLSGRAQITFQKTYGGADTNYRCSVQQTNDGGYIIAGSTTSFGAGNNDIYLIKTNVYGDTLWTKTYGGIGNDFGSFVQQTLDGGFIVCGRTTSFGAGGYDVYLIKINSNGNLLWSKTYGGLGDDFGNCVRQTLDGGYIVVGTTLSFGTGGIYLIKIDSLGDSLWTKTFTHLTPIVEDRGESVQQTNDGGYIICGAYISLVKTDSLGNVQWVKEFNGFSPPYLYSVQQTEDNGFVMVGYFMSHGCLIKTDSIGGILWSKRLLFLQVLESVRQTTDGGYIMTGIYSANQESACLIKTNSSGDILWSKTFVIGNGLSVQQTTDLGYIIGGGMSHTSPYICLIKTDSSGNSGCSQNQGGQNISTLSFPITSPTLYVSTGGIISSPNTSMGNSSEEIDQCYSGINEISSTTSLLLSPNPFTTSTTLTLQGTYHNPSLFIYNLLGQEVRSIPVGTSKQVTIPRGNLPAGMYFYKLIEDNKEVLGIGKLLVE